MAEYVGTGLVSRVIGKLGAHDYMRWKNKLIVRQSPAIVTDPNSAKQQIMRASLADSSSAWYGTLTAAQRANWEAFAILGLNSMDAPGGIRKLPQGNGGKYSGQNAYIMANQLLASAGIAAIVEPPLGLTPCAPIKDLAGSWNAGTNAVDLTWTAPSNVIATDIARVWIDSEQELFHKQIGETIVADGGVASIDTVSAGLGLPLTLLGIVGSKVLLQVDIVRANGLLSGPSNTILVTLT
jgi:hypothetical protein